MATTSTLAVVSDIHGNLPALQAVVNDAHTLGIRHFINLGDSLSGPLYPRETAEYLMSVDWLQIRGNHERQVLGEGISQRGPSDQFTYDALDDTHLAWIRSLPPTAWWSPEVYLCHGTPHSDLEYLLEGFEGTRFHERTPEQVQPLVEGVNAQVVLCGHSHLPRVLRVPHGPLVVNPGSVGLQAYDDEHPVYHQVVNGDPMARYAVLRRTDAGWQAEIRKVAYGCDAVADLAQARGRMDWVEALRTGRLG